MPKTKFFMENVGRKRRLRELLQKRQIEGIPEPYRKSLLEVLEENLKFANRTIMMNRIIYIGEHSFEESDLLAENYEELISDLNSEYCEEKLTGYLLHYDRYFAVVVEGTEAGIIKHLETVFTFAPFEGRLGRMKLLVAYHNINQILLDEWLETTSKPPTLLHPIESELNIPTTYKYALSCIQKLYALGIDIRPEPAVPEPKEKSDDILGKSFSQARRQSVAKQGSSVPRLTLTGASNISQHRFIHCLPEYAVLECLLESRFIQDLREYYKLHDGVVDYITPGEIIWPQQSDYIPMDIFDTPFDPVTDFPPHLQPTKK